MTSLKDWRGLWGPTRFENQVKEITYVRFSRMKILERRRASPVCSGWHAPFPMRLVLCGMWNSLAWTFNKRELVVIWCTFRTSFILSRSQPLFLASRSYFWVLWEYESHGSGLPHPHRLSSDRMGSFQRIDMCETLPSGCHHVSTSTRASAHLNN